MIDRLQKRYCCGCRSCMQVCPKQSISMRMDKEGFYYPFIEHSTCIECGLCEKVCPGIQKTEPSKKLASYALINLNDKVRSESSSGGFFNAVATYVLNSNGIVYGAAFDDRNRVHHERVVDLHNLKKLQKSKYLQSNTDNMYSFVKQDLNNGKLVLVAGTPCQIKALFLFLRTSYNNLITIDVACHGVPSEIVWHKYLKKIGVNMELPYFVDFRDKNYAWHNYTLTIKQNEQTLISEPSDKNSFMRSFVYNLCSRPSCHHCPAKSFTSGSDLMIADYWGIENHYPDMDDGHGTSLVIVKSKRGQEVLEQVINQFKSVRTDFKTVESRYNTFYTSHDAHYKRDVFLRKLNCENFDSLVDKYLKHSYPLIVRFKRLWYRLVRR